MTVNLTPADLRHTEPAATSVPPVMLPPVAPPSEVVPAKTGTDPEQPRKPSPAPPAATPVATPAPIVPVSPGSPTSAPVTPKQKAVPPAEARKIVAPGRIAADRAAPVAAKPEQDDAGMPAAAGAPPSVPSEGSGNEAAPPARRFSATTVMIAVLLLLFGFTLVVQLKANDGDSTLLTARQEDLVRILSDLESQEQRLQQEVTALEDSKQSLSSGAEGAEAALREATERADDLGVLAGELPARGTGLVIRINGGEDQVESDALLNAVQELRGAGAEAMQIEGGDGTAVRVVASTSFTDSPAGQGGDRFGVLVDGKRLTSTYTITVIGDPKTMDTALRIPGGVIESITDDGGNVTVQEQGVVDVSALHDVTTLRYARPVS